MKDLTYKELLDAPAVVQFIYMAATQKIPVGGEMIDEAISKHPEYFPDELDHRRKWELIPQSVHDEYFKECEKLRTDCYKDLPPSKGILGWMNDPEGFEQWNIAYQKCREIEKPLAAALHEKFYGKYGIKYLGH